MDSSSMEYARRLMNEFALLRNVGQETFDYWEPDQPPITILFAAFGKEIARQFRTTDESIKLAMFQRIEEGMSSPDTELATAMATGLIEALISESQRSEGLWPRIEGQLGTRSRKHANSWLQ